MKTSLLQMAEIKKLLLLVIFLNVASSTPQNYTDRDGRRYLIENDDKYNWLEAFDQCAIRQMQLIVIDNADKDSALVALLKSVLGNARQMWIGHHDEFGTSRDKTRPFYSAATGQQLIYGSWAPNSPNNAASKEHCVQLKTNEYKWDDAQCEQRYGFICEEHYLINKSDDNFSHKRDAINHKNSEIISQFEITQSKVKKSIVAAGNVSEQQIDEYSKLTEENLKFFEKSLKAVFLSKPHLQVIWADIGESILEPNLKLQQKQVNLAEEAIEKLTEVNSNLADIVDKTNNEFYSKLKQSKYEVAEILE